MNSLGHFALILAWLLAIFNIAAGIVAGRTKDLRWHQASVRGSLLVFACLFFSTASLGLAFYRNDYSIAYVWQYSNVEMPNIYKVSAIWGGMDGSMLLWCFILSISSALVARQSNLIQRPLRPWVVAVMNSSLLFFMSVVIFLTNPFRSIEAHYLPEVGRGLNPLLQNPYMAIHPPMLYAGFTTLTVPYAFCMAALLSGHLTNDWLRLTRRWTLISWGLLTVGIVLGGHWAYLELGWGGFWAWDPVENASFMPWLTATAFLHSVMVQERKNMLRMWNIWLVIVTYTLTVFGTFLTRSGIVQSVHAFAESDVGWVFLVYIALILSSAFALSLKRANTLKSERQIESFISRESVFLLNNLILASICFAVMWGVMFPVISRNITGKELTVAAPFFNKVTVPLFLAMIFFMGVGPLIAWRKASLKSLRQTFTAPAIVGALSGCLLLWAGVWGFYPVLSYSLAAFVVSSMILELERAVRSQRKNSGVLTGGANLIKRHHVRYGGYLVHFGVVVMTVAITASMAHKMEKEFSLAEGQSFEVGRFIVRLDKINDHEQKSYSALRAQVSLLSASDNKLIASLAPELRSYRANSENTSEVALRMGAREDFYLVLAGLDDSGTRAAFKVFINPLQIWLWIGTGIVVVGTLIALIPKRQRTVSDYDSATISASKAKC